jgi:hypothetical protein
MSLFVPRETNEGDPPANPPADPPQGGSDPDGKPDWLPDKFYDPDTGPRVEVLAKSFTEVEGKLRANKETLAAEINAERLASTPESYEIKLPDDLEVPEGVDITLDPEDAIATWFMGFAKENGLSQEQFDAAVAGYIKEEIAKLPDMTAEIGKLGDYGKDRVVRVNTWLEKSLEGDQLEAMKPLLTSAASVEALESLMKGHTPSDFEGDAPAEGLTLSELQAMQNDPRYWRDHDKTLIAKVKAGYERLYPQ